MIIVIAKYQFAYLILKNWGEGASLAKRASLSAAAQLSNEA
jgi:hypothetical protein